MNLQPLTSDQSRTAKRLLAAAMPVTQIAKRIGVPYWRIYRLTFNSNYTLTVGRPRKTPRCVTGANQGALTAVPIPPKAAQVPA